MNAKKDYNRQSGHDPKKLTDVEAMLDDILHPLKDGKKGDLHDVTVSSPLPVGPQERQVARIDGDVVGIEDEEESQGPPQGLSTPRVQRPAIERLLSQKKRKHGTGSTLAQKKLRLEEQWCSHLKRLEARERRLTEREASLDTHREELIKAKNRKKRFTGEVPRTKGDHSKKKGGEIPKML